MRYAIENEAHWHSLRAANVGGSEGAILMGCGFETEFAFWHQKKGNIAPPDFTDNERVVIGECVEGGIAAAVSKLHGLDLRKANCYYTDDTTPGLGCTPDYLTDIHGEEVPVEIKNASYEQYRDHWIFHDDGTVEPPLRYLIQTQVQMACMGASTAKIVALLAGNRIIVTDVPRHEASIAEIRSRVTAFWKSIADNVEPPAVMPVDFAAASRVWRGGAGYADLSGDVDIETWLEQLRELRAVEKRIADDEAVIKGRILEYVTRHKYSAVNAHAGRISYKWKEATRDEMRLRKGSPARGELRVTTR